MPRSLPGWSKAGLNVSPEAISYVNPLRSASSYEQYLDRLFAYSCADQLDRAHLHRVDELGMAFGLEVRVPFLDNKVLDVATSIPTRHLVNRNLGIRKHVLRRVLIKHQGASMLDIVLREKLTFPSASAKFMGELKALCLRHVPADFVGDHRLGSIVHDVIRLVSFDLFVEIFIEHRGDAAKVGNFSEFLTRRYGPRHFMSSL
jgi:asparagine synthetase B (glutamine-hydrolysing)